MLKKIISIITLLLLSIIMAIYIRYSLLLIIVNFFIPMVICMIIKYNKQRSIIYKVSMDIMLIILSLFVIWFIYNLFISSVRWENIEVMLASINHIIVNILLYLNIINFNYSSKNKYFYVNLIMTIMINFIYLNYYFNPSFAHNSHIVDDAVNYYSEIYISQNYLYFLIIEICTLIYYLINHRDKEEN